MNRRKEQRIPANTPVMVTVLRILGEPSMAGRVVNMSGSGLQLTLSLPIPGGALVKVESGEMLMLGEVVRCEPSASGYAIGVHLSHSLAALSDLKHSNQVLMGPDSGY